ncbi:hypothetical protein GmHk_09G025863 [Glycine max]|nr:hypothetical protein GmHk_09G025863 [Glycine max]
MLRNFTDCATMGAKYLEAVKQRLHAIKQWSPDEIREPIGKTTKTSVLDNGGCMNGNQFMGLRIRFDGEGCTNSARQSIRGAPDSMVEDA